MERVAEISKPHEHDALGSSHARAATPAAESLSPVLQLQQQAGNQAVQQLLRSGYIQAKLAISNPDDPEEREADNVAHTIMCKPAGFPASTPCSCSHNGEMCEECQQKQSQPTISRHASTPSAPAHVPRIVSDVLRSPGHPLDAATRAFFEPRFGHDFSHVRVHTDAPAAESARSINANAYTAGSDVVFGAGQFAPATYEGRRLIAHELTHVLQQKSSRLGAVIQLDKQPPPAVQPDFEEETLRELQRLPAVEEEGISDAERKRRIQVLAARRDRLAVLFFNLPSAKADAIYERLRERRTGDVLSERFHDILATATRKGLLQIIGLRHLPGSLIVFPNPADFCRPFSRREIDQDLDFETANAMDHFVHGDMWLWGDEAADLYDTYLTSTAKNTTPRIFDNPKSELVQSFINHEATAKRQSELAAIIEKNLPDNCGHLPPNEWVDFIHGAIISPNELKAPFSFGGFSTIPAVVAGGVSPGPGVPESRTVSIKQVLLRRSEVRGQTTELGMRAQFHFVVQDAIDFCPGGMGGFLASYVTIPFSRLEASGMAFSVPFEVRYDGPILEIRLSPAAIDACK